MVTGSKNYKNTGRIETFTTGIPVTTVRTENRVTTFRSFRARTLSLKQNNRINLLNAELNPICHLLALLRAHHILHVSRIRIKGAYLETLFTAILNL